MTTPNTPTANIGLALWRLTQRSINSSFTNHQQFQQDETPLSSRIKLVH